MTERPLKDVIRDLVTYARQLPKLDDDLRRSIVRLEMKLRERKVTRREFVELEPGVRLTWSEYIGVWRFVIRDEQADPIRLLEATPDEWVEVINGPMRTLLKRLGVLHETS